MTPDNARLDVEGTWWLPARPDVRAVGTLVFTPKEFYLRVHETLDPADETVGEDGRAIPFSPEMVNDDEIWGLDRAGTEWSLLEGSGLRLRLPFGVGGETIHVTAAIKGGHVRSDARYGGTRFYVRHLHEWLRPPALHAETSTERVLVEASRLELGGANGAFGRLDLQREVHYSVNERHADITSDVACLATFADSASWREALRPVAALCDLVTFATGRVGGASGVYLTPPDEHRRGQSLELIVRTVELRRDSDPERFLTSGDCVLVPQAWNDGIPAMLEAWFKVRDKHATELAQALGPLRAPFAWSHDRYLSIAQGAEILHRQLIGGTPVSKTEHVQRVNAVADLMKGHPLAEWATRVLNESNYLRLSDRILSLCERGGVVGHTILQFWPDFAQHAAKHRNSLTHRGGDKPVFNGELEHYAGSLIFWLIRWHLIAAMAPDRATADELVQQNYQWRREVERAAELVAATAG